MRKIIFLGALCIIILFLAGCSEKRHVQVEIGNQKITAELAETSRERSLGLMFRRELCETCGMVFVFDNETKHSFWMKNTFIPLDMVFINSKQEVVDVLHAEPCTKEPCPFYNPKKNALYVLETNVNMFNESIIGSKVRFVFD